MSVLEDGGLEAAANIHFFGSLIACFGDEAKEEFANLIGGDHPTLKKAFENCKPASEMVAKGALAVLNKKAEGGNGYCQEILDRLDIHFECSVWIIEIFSWFFTHYLTLHIKKHHVQKWARRMN